MTLLEVPLDEIIVPAGRRRLRDLEQLAASIREVGLINPISLTPDRRLVAGYHRLEAFRLLGRERIPALVLTLGELDTTLAELDENLIRNELTVLERAENLKRRKEIFEAKYPQTRAYSPERQRQRRKTEPDEIISPGFASDIASRMGVSERTIQHEVQIAQQLAPDVKERIRSTPLENSKVDLMLLARMAPDRQRAIVHQILTGAAGGVRAADRGLDRQGQIEAVGRYSPPMGKFSVIAIDPPWPYDCRTHDPTHRGAIPYPSMTVEEICAVRIPADENCLLWLWTTNAFHRHAYRVLDAWGFQEKTVLTWTKDRIGAGNWLRGQTEHCILAIRGNPVVNLTNQSTALHAPVREHSRKPEEFYRLVESLCPALTRLEMFAREQREGWTCTGAEALEFAIP